MSAALLPPTLPPEALAIIKEGTPKPQTPNAPLNVAPAKPLSQPERGGTPAVTPATDVIVAAKPQPRREREAEQPPLVAMNVRVPAPLPRALLRASADRKIKRVRPFTQQEIVAEAITDWLHRHGHLRNHE